jgi:hypothetical protein
MTRGDEPEKIGSPGTWMWRGHRGRTDWGSGQRDEQKARQTNNLEDPSKEPLLGT